MSKPDTANANGSDNIGYSGRRVELSLVLEFDEVDEDLMRRKALDYAAEAAREGAFDVEITLIDENRNSRQ